MHRVSLLAFAMLSFPNPRLPFRDPYKRLVHSAYAMLGGKLYRGRRHFGGAHACSGGIRLYGGVALCALPSFRSRDTQASTHAQGFG